MNYIVSAYVVTNLFVRSRGRHRLPHQKKLISVRANGQRPVWFSSAVKQNRIETLMHID